MQDDRDQDGVTERPFQAIVVPGPADLPEAIPASPDGDDDWSVDDIEEAYRRALQVADVAETMLQEADLPQPRADAADSSGDAEAGGLAAADVKEELSDSADAPTVSPRQVIEAVLFVGGRALTSRCLSDLLGGEFPQDRIDDEITALNRMYSEQQRPYEIRLGEGGYRLVLRPGFERVRDRVFGMGPREVKLSQDALEVLAFVAYRQPVTKEDVAETEKKNYSGLLQQLLRRELISLERGEEGGEVRYRTTSRFLQLFGLGSLDDLPRAESVSVR